MSKGSLRNVLVCGIPGSGKTTCCEWLEREKAFVHLDFDELLNGHGTPPKVSLVDFLRQKPEELFAELPERKQPIVIDWGFPMESLPAVRLLQENGFVVWWFDGDREAARQSFVERGTVSLEDFRIQMDSIERNWLALKEVIRVT